MQKLGRAAVLAATLVCALVRGAAGSCGQASCSLDPRLAGRVFGKRHALRLGLEMEYIEQDQPWVRHHAVDVGARLRSDHNEVETTNLAVKWSAEFAVTDRWSLALRLPLVHREHVHLATPDHGLRLRRPRHGDVAHGHDETEVTIGKATGIPERWNFTRVSDLEITGSYTLLTPNDEHDPDLSVQAGLKLPTGDSSVRNSSGERAEMTLQPGSGSVEPLFGVRLRYPVRVAAQSLPAALSVQVRTEATDGRFGYRPGTEAVVSAGTRYALFERLQPALQFNFRYRDRDHAGDAPGVSEEHTGGEALYVTPGLWLGLTERFNVLAFVQVPVMQRVNGIQLVSRWNLLLAITHSINL